jgi:hypothetical protein
MIPVGKCTQISGGVPQSFGCSHEPVGLRVGIHSWFPCGYKAFAVRLYYFSHVFIFISENKTGREFIS